MHGTHLGLRVNGIGPARGGKVSNLSFGGPNFDTLHATCGDSVFTQTPRQWRPEFAQACETRAAEAVIISSR